MALLVRLAHASFVAVGVALALAAGAFAQTVPPGAAAPVPLLPAAAGPPPNTAVPAALSDIPTADVDFSYFGPYANVVEILLPARVVALASVGCWSAPNATAQDQAGDVEFGVKPAGTEFIVFFVRGTRSYVFDTSYGNYCWVDNQYSRR